MKNIKDKACIHPGCDKIPNYNKAGEKNGIYCADHKTPGMKNVKSKTCVHPGCDKIPSFNIPGEKNRMYCSDHESPTMKNVKKRLVIIQIVTHKFVMEFRVTMLQDVLNINKKV